MTIFSPSILGGALAAVGLAMAAPAAAATMAVQSAAERLLENAPEEAWKAVSPQNLLVMELPSGPMIIEMRPDLAPNHVARIQTLARRRFYDGAPFHRVIEGFMAQGGDPTGTGEGGSSLPDLQGEFAQPIEAVADKAIIGRDSRAAQIGFVGSVPVGTQPPTLPSLLVDDTVALWGLHCQGVMSMARTNDPNSANSQFFVMFGDNRDSLDQRYTVWGRVVDGYINARRINRGEPPTRPTPIVRARLMSDLPTDQRKTIEVLDPSTAVFKDYLRARGILSADGFVENACNVSVPVRINGEITS